MNQVNMIEHLLKLIRCHTDEDINDEIAMMEADYVVSCLFDFYFLYLVNSFYCSFIHELSKLLKH